MKRLKYYLLSMQQDSSTYKEMYEGEMVIPFGVVPQYFNDSTYWDDSIGYHIERTNKLELDKPTVIIQIPMEQLGVKNCDVAATDYILRSLKPYLEELNELSYNRSRPDKENGRYYIYEPNGKVLMRNATFFKEVKQKYYNLINKNVVTTPADMSEIPSVLCINILIQVQLPTKKLRKAIQMLTKDLPEAVNKFVAEFDLMGLEKAQNLYKQQESIREWLKSSEYCTFIANGSILPRFKGTDFPLESAIPFQSTIDDEIEICGIKGMGMKRGVTVITGGGYSGKSTLLDAISEGIYNHIAGDGRELVITDETAMKISAEDGRSIKNVNISPFIKWLPGGDTTDFSTEHASGSTSQAANIMEAVNFGTGLLLIDEDKSATNFMIRDKTMKELIEKEPITPFTNRVNELYTEGGISTILVIGGSGEYLAVADKVYMMQDYQISDATVQSKEICKRNLIIPEVIAPADWQYNRWLITEGFTSYPEGSGTEKLWVSDMGFLFIGDERIDIRMLHNISSVAQLNAIGFILRKMEIENKEPCIDVMKTVEKILDRIENDGLESVFTSFFTNGSRFLELPRKNEILAVINRMRKVNFLQENPIDMEDDNL